MGNTRHSTTRYRQSERSEYMIFCTRCNPNSKQCNLPTPTPIYKANSLVHICLPPPCIHQSKMYSLHYHQTVHNYQIPSNTCHLAMSTGKNTIYISDCPNPMSYNQDQREPYCWIIHRTHNYPTLADIPYNKQNSLHFNWIKSSCQKSSNIFHLAKPI